MTVLRMVSAVRAALGERTADAMRAGSGLPADAQCWGCGGVVNLVTAGAGSVTLSAVVIGPVTVPAFAHRGCGPSRVFTPEEFEQVAPEGPSPVAGGEPVMIIDGVEYR